MIAWFHHEKFYMVQKMVCWWYVARRDKACALYYFVHICGHNML